MEIVNAVLNLSINAVEKANARAWNMSTWPGLSSRKRGALEDCLELFNETLDELYDTLFNLKDASFMAVPQKVSDLETLLSAAITNQYTCLDSSSRYNLRQNLEDGLMNISHLVSNSLAIVKYIASQVSRLAVNSIHNRRLLSGDQDSDFMIMESDGFPSWMSAGQRTNI